jgi:DNA-binding beta-propeller fold protein YncE
VFEMRRLALSSVLLRMLLVVASAAGALTLVGTVTGADAIQGAEGTVLVTERQLGSVAALDGATGQVLWWSKTGASPIGVTQPRHTHKVYTSDEGSNRMSVFDLQTGALLTTIAMGLAPHHLMASPSGDLVYVGEFGQNTVGVVDTATDTEIAHFLSNPLAEARTHAVFIARNGVDLYATNTRVDRAQPGDVSHIDATTGELLCNTGVGADPSEILVTRDGHIGYVSVRRENKVKELDLSGHCPLLTGRETDVGIQPDTLQLTNDGRTLVVTLRNPAQAQITLVDTESFTSRIVTIPGHSTTGHHWLSADGRYSFVAVESPAGVAVVDNHSGQTLADYPYPNPPGGSRAHGLYFVPQVLR